MTSAAYSSALDDAYAQNNPASIIYAVKQAVINQIREVDNRVEIKSTEYFNHSFAPDLILMWNGGAVERHLYVRQDDPQEYIADDAQQFARTSPIVFNLDPRPISDHISSVANRTLERSDTLLTDAAAMSEVGSRKQSSRVVEVAAPAVLQGGRGVLDEETAGLISSGLARGFIGAENLKVDETRAAVNLIERFFRSSYAARLTEFLRAVWVGAGGHLSDFPGQTKSVTGLTDEALKFLLDFESNESLVYWRRVGEGLTIERIVGMNPSPSANFDRLMVSNLDRVTGRACGVFGGTVDLFDTDDTEWRTDGNALIWQSPESRMRFAHVKDSAPPSNQMPYDGIPLGVLLRRAIVNGISLESVQLLASSRRIDYGSTQKDIRQDIANDEQLQTMADSFGSSGLVHKAVSNLPTGRSLICDYSTRVASGRSGAKFTIQEFLRFAVPLFVDLGSADIERIRELTEINSRVSVPPSLF